MLDARGSRARSLLDEYCIQLGLLLERRNTHLALIEAKNQAEGAAVLAEQAMVQAQEADRAKTNFLANVTHELRTPLNAIIGFSEIIRVTTPPGETATHAEYIHSSGTHLLKILNKVLDLARIEAGKLVLEEQVVAIGEIFESAVRAVRATATEASVMIACDGALDLPIHVDAAKISQVLVNLLSNAVAATPAGGRVELGATLEPAGGVVVSVGDTGIGIANENIDQVLSPFGQVEDHLTRGNEGIGLGLPMARALVQAHGGELSITSELGVGTTVYVRLPTRRVRESRQADAAE